MKHPKEKILISFGIAILLSAPIINAYDRFEQRFAPKVCTKWGERQVTRTTTIVDDGVVVTFPRPFTVKHCLEREYVES